MEKKSNELSADEIKGVTALSELDEPQISAIINLSRSVIDRTTRGVYDSFDSDLTEVLGQKPDGLKTLAWVAQSVKTAIDKTNDYDSLLDQVSKLKQDNAELGKKDSGGNIDALKKQLQDKDDQIALISKTSEAKILELTKASKDTAEALIQSQIDVDLIASMKDIAFNESIPASIREETLEARKRSILSSYDKEVVDGKVVFRKDGEIVRNPENGFNPSSAFDLLMPNIKDLIDEGRQASGVGGKSPKGKGVTIGEARTQVQADKMISDHLISLGVERLSDDFINKQMELRAEMKVSELPMN